MVLKIVKTFKPKIVSENDLNPKRESDKYSQ